MIRKIILILLLVLLLSVGNNAFVSSLNASNRNSVQSTDSAGGNSGPINSGNSNDITSKDFEIDTSLFSIGGNSLKGDDSKKTIENALGNTIKKLMIALGVVSLFVMVIGTGYMILYRGHDEYLSKGKNIFIGGITALVVALCSYYLVNLIGYILYN